MMPFEGYHNITIGDLLTHQAILYPDRTYLQLGEERWTYQEAEEMADAFASGLIGLGMKPGDRLAIILPNNPVFVLTFFGAAKAGILLVPVNVQRSKVETLSRLLKTTPKAVVTFSDPANFSLDHLTMMEALRDELPSIQHLIAFEPSHGEVINWNGLLSDSSTSQKRVIQPEDPAAIIHTLGSMGEPRGVILTHLGLVRNAASMAAHIQAVPEDVFLGAVPFSNAFGLTANVLACTIAGGRLICLPKYHPTLALELMTLETVTVHHGVPTMFAMELNSPEFDKRSFPALRTGIMSGAPCPPEMVTRVQTDMGCNIILAYGQTEASPVVTMTRLDDGPVTKTESVGRPLEGLEIKIIDLEGNVLPDGKEGELCVRGYNVMLGYWDESEATDQVLDQEGWLHTGDLAVIDPNGPVRIIGRKDDIIIRSGFQVHPGTVEMILLSYPGVKEVSVVGVPDLIYGELTIACVVLESGEEVTKEEILDYSAKHLSEYSIPDRIIFFDALPRRGGGPVLKHYLRERVRIRGRAWKFGTNIDTDAIIPARRCNTSDPRELAQFCMEDADESFVKKMKRGDIIIAEENFGCGSSREVAPLAIKAAGVSAVIAKSFARIFFRNSINIGLPILECPGAVDGIVEGDEVEVEPPTGMIHNLTRGEVYTAEAFPEFLQQIIDLGGLLAYVEARLSGRMVEEV
jgi:3-isopropylmalate dehydratase small subunit